MTRRLPSGLNAALHTFWACPLMARTSWPLLGIPHLRCPVIAAGDDAFAVGAERHAAHVACVPLEGEKFLAISRRPTPSPSGQSCR